MGSSFMRTSIHGAVLAIAAIAAPAVAHGQGTKQFQGVVTFQTDEGQTFQYAVRQGLVRIDMNGQSRHGAMIMDPASHKMYMLMPEQKTYMEMKLSGLDEVDHSPTNAAPTKTGKSEVVAGHKCEYWTVKEEKGQVDVCLAKDMGGFMVFDNSAIGEASAWQQAIGKDSFPLKVVIHKDEGDEVALVATKVDPKPLDASLFTPPSSYKKMEMNMKMPGTPR
jgi:hypothetical protein